MSSQDYYEDSASWGNYQFITLDQIINNYMMGRDSDDYAAVVPRYKVLYQAKRALRELYYDVVRDVRAIELELSPLLNVTVPPDYVKYVRISWVDEFGKLRPLAIDRSLSMAEQYLQDHQYNILFDEEGDVLIGDGKTAQAKALESGKTLKNYIMCDTFRPNKDLYDSYPNGRFNFDQNTGVIQFGSEVFGKSIVLEYISDGLYTGTEGRPESDIRIHKFAESAVINFINYELIKNRRNVPMNEKMRARKEYYNSRRITKRRINALSYSDLIQVFRGVNKWIKN